MTLITEDNARRRLSSDKTRRKCRNRSLMLTKAKNTLLYILFVFIFVLCRHGFRIFRPENGRNLPGGKYILQAFALPHDLSVSGRPETHLEKHRPAPQRYYQRYDSGFFSIGIITFTASYLVEFILLLILGKSPRPGFTSPVPSLTNRTATKLTVSAILIYIAGNIINVLAEGRPFQRAFLQAGPPRPFRKICQPAPGAAF